MENDILSSQLVRFEGPAFTRQTRRALSAFASEPEYIVTSGFSSIADA